MAYLHRELGEENSALAKLMEDLLTKHFREAKEKSEARANRLEKRIDGMNTILLRHKEEIKDIRFEMANLQERGTNSEKFAALCKRNLQDYEAKLTDIEDRA